MLISAFVTIDTLHNVMAGHSRRPKDGVALLAYVPGSTSLIVFKKEDVNGRDKRGHDGSTFKPFGIIGFADRGPCRRGAMARL